VEEIEGMKTASIYSGLGSARAYGEDRSLFQPDALLDDRYLENFRSKTPLEGERTLLLAVLEDGISCFQDNVLPRNRKKQMLFEEAQEWLFSDDSDWLFSFVSICTTLGLEQGSAARDSDAGRSERVRRHEGGAGAPGPCSSVWSHNTRQ
jgi:hypothetical protein